MIDCYLDEAGIHDGAPMCLVAGFFGGKGQWKKVADAWSKVLHRYGVPLDKFHALEAVKRRKFFQVFDEEKHTQFLVDLASAIVRFNVRPVSHGIVVADFNCLTENQRRFCTGAELTETGKLVGTGNPNKPYYMPFLRVVRDVAHYAPVGGRATFFFGLNRPFAGYAEEMFRTLKDQSEKGNARERIGEAAFPLAKETPELQAADYFAYLCYDHARKCLDAGHWHLRADPWLDAIIRKARSTEDLVFYDGRALHDILYIIPVDLRVSLD